VISCQIIEQIVGKEIESTLMHVMSKFEVDCACFHGEESGANVGLVTIYCLLFQYRHNKYGHLRECVLFPLVSLATVKKRTRTKLHYD